MVAPLPIDARSFTTVLLSSQAFGPSKAPSPSVARGHKSFVNITPCPTKTSFSIVTPSHKKLCDWILHLLPTKTLHCISTNGPIRVSSPIWQSYKLTRFWSTMRTLWPSRVDGCTAKVLLQQLHFNLECGRNAI